ncbi:MAG: hypothetical protein Q4A46_08740 [Clostridia bacterium]|nr:hypothetical protein [Clostridia bacterium]
MTKKKKNSKIVMIDDKSTELKGFSKKSTSSSNKKKTAQDTVPFDEIYDNGLIRKDETFSIIFKFENIDYKVMRESGKDQFYQK